MSASAITLWPVTLCRQNPPVRGADQICSVLYQNFNLTICHRDTAAIHSLADTETGTNVFDIRGTHFHLQFSGLPAFDIKISVASQQFDLGAASRIADSDTAVGIQTDRRYRVSL